MRHPDWLTTQPVAHRGLHKEGVPENTLAAFEEAVAGDFAIECDVQLAGCGTAMVFHDDHLDRLTNETGPVDARSAAHLAALHIAGTGETIPRLKDMLALVAGRVPLLIELKGHDPDVGALESAVCEDLAEYKGAYAVQSFNPNTVYWYLVRAPHICRGQIACKFDPDQSGLPWWRRMMQSRLWFNWITKPDFVAYGIDDLHLPAPQRWRRGGKPLLTWTVKSAAHLEKARALADNVIFETIRP